MGRIYWEYLPDANACLFQEIDEPVSVGTKIAIFWTPRKRSNMQ
jgi:hypothetical protein